MISISRKTDILLFSEQFRTLRKTKIILCESHWEFRRGFHVVNQMKNEDAPKFFGRTKTELEELLLTECSVKERFRSGQIYEWLYGRRAKSFSEMTNLPRSLQRILEERYTIPSIECSH